MHSFRIFKNSVLKFIFSEIFTILKWKFNCRLLIFVFLKMLMLKWRSFALLSTNKYKDIIFRITKTFSLIYWIFLSAIYLNHFFLDLNFAFTYFKNVLMTNNFLSPDFITFKIIFFFLLLKIKEVLAVIKNIPISIVSNNNFYFL